MKTIDIPSEKRKADLLLGRGGRFWEKADDRLLGRWGRRGEGESLALVFSQANGASAAALVVHPQTQEQDVGDWLCSLRQREDVNENKITLTGTLSAAGLGLASGEPFPPVVCGDLAPWEAMGIPMKSEPMKDVPLRAYPV